MYIARACPCASEAHGLCRQATASSMCNVARHLVGIQTDCKKLTQAILTQSLSASANGQHRDGCLLLGTINSAEDKTICVLSTLAYITPCSLLNS